MFSSHVCCFGGKSTEELVSGHIFGQFGQFLLLV